MILYDDVTMVLEAMDIDPVMGARDWISGYHVEDALALAEALFWSQARRPMWTSKVAGDPFRQELARWQDELMIEPAATEWARPVSPSYFTWRPGPEYIAQKVCDFLNDRDILSGLGRSKATWRVANDRKARSYGGASKYLRVLLDRQDGRPHMLVEVPEFHAYATTCQLKAELARYLFAALEVAMSKNWLGYGPKRQPFFDAMSYVDGLWGAELMN